MTESLTILARQFVAALWKMFRAKRPPATLPWPPGLDVRIIYHGTFGQIYQLREGARMPDRLYLDLMQKAQQRASIQSAAPCTN